MNNNMSYHYVSHQAMVLLIQTKLKIGYTAAVKIHENRSTSFLK